MLYTAEKQPAVFFATCARLLPNDVRVTVEQSLPGDLSMEDWQAMKEVTSPPFAKPFPTPALSRKALCLSMCCQHSGHPMRR